MQEPARMARRYSSESSDEEERPRRGSRRDSKSKLDRQRESSDEEGELVDRDGDRRGRDRENDEEDRDNGYKRQVEDKDRERQRDRVGARDSNPSSDEEVKRHRRERERRSRRHDNGDRRREEEEDRYRSRERDYRGKSERDSDVKYEKRGEGGRNLKEKETGGGKADEGTKPNNVNDARRYSSESSDKEERPRRGSGRDSKSKLDRRRECSDEEGELVDRDRRGRDRERNDEEDRDNGYKRQVEDKDRERERDRVRARDSNPSSDEEEERDRRKRERERERRSRRHDNGHRRREEQEDRYRSREMDYRGKSERGSDVKYEKRGEGGRNLKEKEEGGRKADEGTKPNNVNNDANNADAAGWGKSGGVYIPPFKLARMMKEVEDKSSPQYQRLTWDALRKSINGLVNKVNATNIKNIIPELFSENLIRGRGLFCRSCMKSQMASPAFTDVFAALVAVVNTKFPEVGELLLRRIVLQLRRAYERNDKHQLLAVVKFIAHLVNQQVAHEIIALELLAVLLENPTDDSVEVAVGFVTECGSLLQDVSPKGLDGAFERFRGILHEGEIDKRVQFLIEGLFAIRKAKFQGYPAVRPELDLVEQEDQLTHEISLQEKIDPEITLDIFKPDPNFLETEKRYEELKKSILGEESDNEEGSDASDDEDEDDDDGDDESEEEDDEKMKIKDETETNLINLRRTIYLTIMSSVDFEEAGHKLLKIKLEPGQEMELCIMLLECCSQERTYLRYYGLLGQRFCMIKKVHQENFEKCFVQQYSMIHRLETNKLRNVAKFFAHLLGTDALPWHVLAYIRLTEEDTTSSSRIFIKILFQELSEHLGIRTLNDRLTDPTMQESFESIFPRDNPKNTRFSINFFTSIGLGGITENLREYLKNMPRLIMQQQKAVSESETEDKSDSSDSSGSDSGSPRSESDEESEQAPSSSDEDDRSRKRSRRERDERNRKRSRRD